MKRLIMDNVTISTARNSDIPALVRGNLAMAHETEGLNLDQSVVADGVAAVFADSGRGFYLVARCDNKVVGQLMITSEWSDWRNRRYWWIQSLYIIPAYRRRGILHRMYRHALNLAEKQGDVCGIRLYVHRDNQTAQRSYARLKMAESHYLMYEFDFD